MIDIRSNVLSIYIDSDRKKCKVCEKREWIETNNGSPSFATLEIPTYGKYLRIYDTESLEEYLFEVRFCPFCGRMLTTPFYWENEEDD